MKRLLLLCCTLAMSLVFLSFAPAASASSMADGISPLDAMTALCACAMTQGIEPDMSGFVFSDNTITTTADIYTLTVEHKGNTVIGVSVSCGYLDADYAKTFGALSGSMLSSLGDIHDPSDILTSIDFESFNHMEASTQTLISGAYKIIAAVDPEQANCYRISLKLRDTSAVSASDQSTMTALSILQRMNPELSGYINYTAETDVNHVLGKAGGYSSKVNFALVSLDPEAAGPDYDVDQGGSIEVFDNTADAISRMQKILSSENTYFGYTEYLYLCNGTLLRMSRNISAEEAGNLVIRFMKAASDAAYFYLPSKTIGAENSQPVTTEDTSASKPVVMVNPGDKISFGHYEQDNNTANGKEAIDWIVLKVDGDSAMLLSTYALDVYNTYWDSTTWDNSTLRTWCNSAFLEEAFSGADQEALLTRNVPADKNPNYSSLPGTDTQDRVFCLSYPEAQSLLTISQRKTQATAYAQKSKNAYIENGYCYWWLRTPGKPDCGAAIVCADGSFDYDVSYDGFCYGFRPAVWVDLSKLSIAE